MFWGLANAVMSLVNCRKGAAMVEYAIIAAMIAMVGTVALTALGTSMKTMFNNLASQI